MESQLADLPENVRKGLNDFINVAKESISGNLQSVVLFGSAAEGRLRSSSDVNLILVLKEFEVPQVNRLRESLRMAHAAINLNVMFLLQSEITAASEAFAVKFSDILSRHRILLGENPFGDLQVSRSATIQRLNQVLVNLILRMRERYAMVSLREEQLVPIIADAAGPIRASAATILSLEGQKNVHPKEALQIFLQRYPENNWADTLKNMSIAREELQLKAGEATNTLLGILVLLKKMQQHVQNLK
jgi:predicted nucleotidyltransferase